MKTAIDILDEMIGEYGFGGEEHPTLLALQEAKSRIQVLGDKPLDTTT